MRSLGRIRTGAAVFDDYLNRLAFDRASQHQTRPSVGWCRLNGIAQQTGQGRADLAGVGVDGQALWLQRHFDAYPTLSPQFVQTSGHFTKQGRQIEPTGARRRGFGELHQLAQNAVNAARLSHDRFQGLARCASGILAEPVALVAEKILCLTRDDGERIVDLVASAGGEFGQGGELAGLQSPGLAMHLFFQRALQGVDFAFEMIVQWLFAESAILRCQFQQIAQKGNLVRILPSGKRHLV